mgnify:CR=1 FL=1
MSSSRHGNRPAYPFLGHQKASSLAMGAVRHIPAHVGTVVAVLVLVALTVWSYWPTLVGLFNAWGSNEDYSAGLLVPLVALVFLWRDRKGLKTCIVGPSWRLGLPLLILAQAFRMHGYFAYRFSAERYSIVLTVAALVVLLAGGQMLRRVAHILLFLFLMFPLPGTVHNLVSDPLQRLATAGSAFLLQAFGVRLTLEGNVITLGDGIPVTVAEACSGLRMLTAFIIVAAFIAYMVKRPRWYKAVLLASGIPVAVACNIIRIVLTGMLILFAGVEIGHKFFHDFAGLVMMPVAVTIMFGEIWLLDTIFEPNESEQPRERRIVVARSVRRAAARSSGA